MSSALPASHGQQEEIGKGVVQSSSPVLKAVSLHSHCVLQGLPPWVWLFPVVFTPGDH